MFTKGTKIFHETPPGRPARFKYQPVPDFGAAAGTPEEMREFKMYGEKETATEPLGTSRAPFTWKQPKTPELTKTPSYFDLIKPEWYEEAEYPTTGKYGIWNPTKIRTSALPPLFKLSRKKFNEAAQKLGVDTFGSRSIDKVKDLVKKAEEYRINNQIRYNSISMGNPMSFGIPLYYDINGKISEEYPCPKEWKKIENHKGNLWLYDDLGHNGERITVGTYEYLGWDDELELPMVKFDYDEKLIRQKINNTESEIIKRLDQGLEPEMSTEYYCKTVNHEGKTWQMDFRDAEGRPRFDGIAIVEFGNCPAGHCNFERVDNATFDTSKPGRWITRGGKHVYIPFKERELILYHEEEEGKPQYIQSLYSHPKEETLYAQFYTKGGEFESMELATHVDEMIKIKKWLEKRIEKILGTPEEVKKYEKEYIEDYQRYQQALNAINLQLNSNDSVIIQDVNETYTRKKINSKTLQEWIQCCIKKHGPSGDKSMTKDQCVAAGYKKFGKSKSK